MRIIRTASLRPLAGKTIAILGYGSQGRAQALNLRDSGFAPLIGLPTRSRSRITARRDGFRITKPADAVQAADIIFVLAPDHLHGEVYEREICPHLRQGQMLVFAHGSSVHFGLVAPPPTVDVVLIAPLGPGQRLRELRGQRDGVACFLAIHQNASRRARPIALALAKAIGCLPAGAIETTFALESVGDLFGEQAALCGGLSALLQAAVDTLVRHGFNPHTAYLECVYQLDLIVDLIKSEGLAGMFARISPTAAHGATVAGPRIITAAARRAMDGLLAEIQSGRFFREWAKTAHRRTLAPSISPAFRRGEADVRKAQTRRRSRRRPSA